MDLTGKIKLIKDEQSFPSGFTKREFVVTTEEQYPQDVQFELLKDKTSLIGNYNVGDTIKVHFNIRGSEYQGRYYVNLQAWRLEAATAGAAAAPSAPAYANASAPAPVAPTFDATVDDDLPF
jgi:type 1 fimbria pilin